MPTPPRLGRYVVRRRIGSGAFATVWLAHDDQLDSPVAIKVLAENWTEDQHVRQRFLEEGRFLRKVESPYVVTVYDAGELEDGRPYLVMSYADQGTLADRLELEGLTPAQALDVVRQVGTGLHALHERGVLHRDLKPANVLFRTVDAHAGPGAPAVVRAMVADLGLGKALDVSSRLSVIAGTPSFMAPEQARGEPLDGRADQYSLAALTYLLLSGRAPYRHASLSAAADPAAPAPLSTPQRRFPARVEQVVLRGLARDPAERWPDVLSYADALADSLADSLDRGVAETAASPWLLPDPDLTQPGARPTIAGAAPPAPAEPARTQSSAGRRRVLAGLACLAVVVAGGAAGYAAAGLGAGEVTVTDDTAQLSVTVPASWEVAVSRSGWQPPGQEEHPALSVGTSRGWTRATSGQGVFVGLLDGSELPVQLPQHPQCREAGAPVDDDSPLGTSVTVVYTGCPGGVTVERVVQVTTNQLMWVQVRSEDRRTANQVLDDVAVHGLL